MKKIIIILFSMVMAQELEVDGDLKVTGTVHIGSIDSSLQHIILKLQERVSLLEMQNHTTLTRLGYIEYIFGLSDSLPSEINSWHMV